MILSAAGVIVALIGTTTSVAAIVGQALAIAAGAAAAWVIVPASTRQSRRGTCGTGTSPWPRCDPARRAERPDPAHAQNEARLVTKARRLRSASVLLLGSAVIILVSGILRTAG